MMGASLEQVDEGGDLVDRVKLIIEQINQTINSMEKL